MATTRDAFEAILHSKGVGEDTATKIMDAAIPKFKGLIPEYDVTWERPANEYPEAFYGIGYVTIVKPAALAWIDENLPRAWYRPMFL